MAPCLEPHHQPIARDRNSRSIARILRAVAPGERYITVPYVRPGKQRALPLTLALNEALHSAAKAACDPSRNLAITQVFLLTVVCKEKVARITVLRPTMEPGPTVLAG